MNDISAAPRISTIIPVFRESPGINDLIGHLRQLDRENCCEIIVVDGAPARDTLAAIEDPDVVKLGTEKGRSRQMNAGAAMAAGDILLFLHADTYLPDRGIKLILETMDDARFVAGSFGFSFDSDRRALGVLSRLASIRTRLTRLPLGDHAIFIRGRYFAAVGGYPDIPIMEDLELMRRIKKRGGRVKILKDRIRTSPRRIEDEGLAYSALRGLVLLFSYSMGVSPQRLKRYYPDTRRRPGDRSSPLQR